MPIKLEETYFKTFILEQTDKKYGSEGEPTTVTIKQATQSEHEQRNQMFATLERRFSDANPGEMSFVQTANTEELKRIEVWLSLCDCNILDSNGKPLFQSKKSKGGQPSLNMTKQQFAEAWGLLPPDVATEIHNKVIEVNFMWGPSGG